MIPRQQKRKKYLDPGTVIIIKQVLLGLFIFSVLAAVIALVWYGTRLSAFTITTVTVEGGVTIDKEDVKKRAEAVLEGAYLRLIPKRFAYFYPEETMYAEVNKVERIKDVSIERLSGTEVYVSFAEYLPDTLWCDTKIESTCYFFDATGFAFAAAPVLSGESLVRYYSSEGQLELGKRPFLEEDYDRTKEFTNLLSSIGWFVTKIEINSARDVFYTLSQGGELKTTLTVPVADTFSNLETILRSEEFDHIKPGNFKYLDLRFGTRVFVNEEWQTEVATSTATTTEEVVSGEVLSPEIVIGGEVAEIE